MRNKVCGKCTWIIPKPPHPPWVHGKIVFHEIGPWCKIAGDAALDDSRGGESMEGGVNLEMLGA